jgi:hypothetical protein
VSNDPEPYIYGLVYFTLYTLHFGPNRQALANVGRTEEALTFYSRASKADIYKSLQASDHRQFATAMVNAGRWGEAEVELKKALAKFMGHPDTLWMLGDVQVCKASVAAVLICSVAMLVTVHVCATLCRCARHGTT